MGKDWLEIISPQAFDAALPADVPFTDRPGGRRIGTARVLSAAAAPGGLEITARLDADAAAVLFGPRPAGAALSFLLPDDGDLIARMTRPV